MTVDRELADVGINLSSQRPRVARALVYIAEHYREPITVDDVAAAAGCGDRVLQDRFRTELGVRPFEVIQRLRLQWARQFLLQQTAGVVHIREVAAASGMPHAGRFSVRYRERYGETPSETLQWRLDAQRRHGRR
ncbi:Helix-turn-helix domain-containing protein [Curtobacterium sp. 9128]|uniref:helix-turn-helix domain-containing protein n=1 Tax=Curtobacterium sp. 9128 TaxID=1793722 RepID=UPI0007D71486|nr:helix-turn-helix transcriptional regulator [Curtobacterium sp. 9128]SBN64471.1 Helix-turn-helix domain-containing protein [Curtobacterium sp. 9128]